MTPAGSVRTGPARSSAASRGRARPGNGMLRRILVGALGVLVLALLWELYIFLGPADGVIVGGLTVLPRASEMAMPHLWVMLERILEPVTGSASAIPMWQAVLEASLFTLGISAVGWFVGVTVGLALALLMQRFALAESAILPWVILSQPVPLIALARGSTVTPPTTTPSSGPMRM